jgi:hypothetical protein
MATTTAVDERPRPVPGPAADAVPYGSYTAIASAFAAILVVTTAFTRARGRGGRCGSMADLAVLSAATFKCARVVSHERLGRIVREPLVEDEDGRGLARLERPAGSGLRRALGELVTCSRCTGTWAAAGLVATEAAAPRFGGVLRWTLAASAANDFLQAGFAVLREQAPGVRA